MAEAINLIASGRFGSPVNALRRTTTDDSAKGSASSFDQSGWEPPEDRSPSGRIYSRICTSSNIVVWSGGRERDRVLISRDIRVVTFWRDCTRLGQGLYVCLFNLQAIVTLLRASLSLSRSRFLFFIPFGAVVIVVAAAVAVSSAFFPPLSAFSFCSKRLFASSARALPLPSLISSSPQCYPSGLDGADPLVLRPLSSLGAVCRRENYFAVFLVDATRNNYKTKPSVVKKQSLNGLATILLQLLIL